MSRPWLRSIMAALLCLAPTCHLLAQTADDGPFQRTLPVPQSSPSGATTGLYANIGKVTAASNEQKSPETLPAPTQQSAAPDGSVYESAMPPGAAPYPSAFPQGALPPPVGAAAPARRPIFPRLRSFFNNLLFDFGNQKPPALPLGTTIYKPFQIQVANGIAARMILYDYDFLPGSPLLNYRGKQRIAWIARRLPQYPNPVIVEDMPRNPQLALARRQSVLQALSAHMHIAPNMVVVGPPVTRGLRGTEPIILYGKYLTTIQQGGGNGYSGGSFGGSFGGANISGTGGAAGAANQAGMAGGTGLAAPGTIPVSR